MATIGDSNPTIVDVAKRKDPDGKIDMIVEMLNETNEVLDDMTFLEGNLPTGHRVTVRTGLPTATWRAYNAGVPNSKSRTAQLDFATGMLESYAEIDKALADLNGNSAAFRMSEDRAFLEAMNQEMTQTLFYGSKSSPTEFVGLSSIYNSISTDETEAGYNILDGGGTGSDNTSVWLIVWGPNTLFGIYPQGSTAGWQHNDLGEETLFDGSNNKYQGYRTHYKWDSGLCVKDHRFAVRIANLDYSNLAAGTGADLIDLMSEATEQVESLTMGRPAFYMNRKVRTLLRKQMRDKTNVNLTFDTAMGKEVMSFDGIPVRRCDQLLLTEAQVT